MKRVIVKYGIPSDPVSFNNHYVSIHVPLVNKMPFIKSFEYSCGSITSSDQDANYQLIAILSYDSQDELDKSLNSSEGQAAVADLENFATGGVEIITIEIAP